MLFPLSNNIESDCEQNFDETVEFIENSDPQLIVEDSDGESLKEEPTYQGPMTCSHTQLLMKANLLMRMHFGDNQCFEPKQETWISSLYQKAISFLKCFIKN